MLSDSNSERGGGRGFQNVAGNSSKRGGECGVNAQAKKKKFWQKILEEGGGGRVERKRREGGGYLAHKKKISRRRLIMFYNIAGVLRWKGIPSRASKALTG